MAKRYIFVRMPVDIYKKYTSVKADLEQNITKITQKPVKLTMPKVFNAVVSQDINIDLKECLVIRKKK